MLEVISNKKIGIAKKLPDKSENRVIKLGTKYKKARRKMLSSSKLISSGFEEFSTFSPMNRG